MPAGSEPERTRRPQAPADARQEAGTEAPLQLDPLLGPDAKFTGQALARIANPPEGQDRGTAAQQRTPRQMLGLQRSVGNRTVSRLVEGGRGHPRGQALVQRDDPPAAGGARTPPFGSETALRRAQQIRATATVRLGKVAAYNATADEAIAAYRRKRITYATRWGTAWDRHNRILTAAGEEAATQNMIEGVVIGTIAGVLVAAAATALFPVAAGAAAFSATWFAFGVGTEVVSNVAGAAVGSAVGRPNVGGPTSGRSDAAADAWEAIARVEATARHVATLAPRFGLEVGNAEYTIAQVQAHIDGGTTDMGWADTLDMASTLANWEAGIQPFDRQIDDKKTAMDRFKDAAENWEAPEVDRLEREIWLAWISQLRDNEVLDQDAIQSHLGSIGIIGTGGIYDPGVYMSDDDQAAIVSAARGRVAEAGTGAEASGAPPPR